jgi:ATP-dependent Zn protease
MRNWNKILRNCLSRIPGTGKTLLTKATAGEAGVVLLSVSRSAHLLSLVNLLKCLQVGSSVRDLFSNARKWPLVSFLLMRKSNAISERKGNFGGGGAR